MPPEETTKADLFPRYVIKINQGGSFINKFYYKLQDAYQEMMSHYERADCFIQLFIRQKTKQARLLRVKVNPLDRE